MAKTKHKVKRFRCGMIVTFLASKSKPGPHGDQFPGRYYGACKRRRRRASTDKTRVVNQVARRVAA